MLSKLFAHEVKHVIHFRLHSTQLLSAVVPCRRASWLPRPVCDVSTSSLGGENRKKIRRTSVTSGKSAKLLENDGGRSRQVIESILILTVFVYIVWGTGIRNRREFQTTC